MVVQQDMPTRRPLHQVFYIKDMEENQLVDAKNLHLIGVFFFFFFQADDVLLSKDQKTFSKNKTCMFGNIQRGVALDSFNQLLYLY